DCIEEIGSDDGIAADADAGGLADTEFGQLADRFISQRAGARDHTNVTLQMNVTGHNADLAFAGRDDAGAIGADEARIFGFEKLPGLHHVDDGNAFGYAHDEGDAGVGGFHDGVGRVGRRNKDHGRIGGGGFGGFGYGVEYRTLKMGRSAFAGGDASD